MPTRGSVVVARRRSPRTAILASVIIGASIVVAAGFIVKARESESQGSASAPVVAEFDTVAVPVPVNPVPAGTLVKDMVLRTVSYPKHQLPTGSIVNITEYREAATVAALPANLPLFAANLSFNASSSNPVLERIPEGMRAMTVKVDATSAVEGWAGSGSVVDVLLIERDRTTVIAEQVKILSAERSVAPVEGQSAPNVPSTVTLLVSQEQCLAINTAIPRGRIAFALRGSRDQETWRDSVYTAERLAGAKVADNRSKTAIQGYVRYDERGKKQAFALLDGKWVSTEVQPDGVLLGRHD